MNSQTREIQNNNNEKMKLALYILLMPWVTLSQTLTEGSKVKVAPAGGEEVVLYSVQDCDHCYYYLPSSLRISMKKDDGKPEASLVTWKDDKTSKAIGGILHFLVEWGLKAGYEKDVQKVLRSERDSVAVIMGPVMVDAYDSGTVIDGNDKLSGILTASLKNIPSVPSTPGAKMALSFRFTEKEIEDFLYYVHHPEKVKTNLKVTYTYSVHSVSGLVRTHKTTLRLPFRKILATVK
jgi:hypothetical protein